MSSALLFAQFRSSYSQPENVLAFIGFTLVFLFLFWLFGRADRLATTLIAWGILVAMLSVGYAGMESPAVVQLTPTLTKIGFLLVLAGIVLSFLPSATSDNRESKDV